MATRDRLRLPLTVTAIYTAAVGIIQFFPSLAQAVFSRPISDPAIESLLGAVLLGMAGLAGALAYDRNRSSASVLTVIAALLLASANMIYFWTLGEYTLATALAPVALELLLAAWVGTALARSARSVATASVRR